MSDVAKCGQISWLTIVPLSGKCQSATADVSAECLCLKNVFACRSTSCDIYPCLLRKQHYYIVSLQCVAVATVPGM